MEKQNPKWNVMIFLAGNNNLSEDCVFGLTEAVDAKVNDNVAIFAQLSTGVHHGTFLNLRDPRLKDRDQLHKELNAALMKQHNGDADEEDSPQKMSLSERIIGFVDQCVRANGEELADHHMLILAGHGDGTLGEFLREDGPENHASAGKPMNVPNLGALIKTINKHSLRGRQIDVLGMDSCLMSMTEIAYAVHNNVKVMIGAEGFEPLAGWPYREILGLVSETPDDLNELGRRIVNEYIEFYTIYQAADLSVDLAASDLSETVMVMKAINSLSRALTPILASYPNPVKTENFPERSSAVVRDAVLLAHWEAQLYKNEQYTDIYDFCTLLKARLGEEYKDVRRACQNVLNAIVGAEKEQMLEGDKWEPGLADPKYKAPWSNRETQGTDGRWMGEVNFQTAKGFILKSCYSGWAVQYSFGVSVYFPWSEVPADMKEYKKLNFARDSRWGEFLDVYLSATKRDPRPGKPDHEGEPIHFEPAFLRDNFAVAPTTFGRHRHAESNRHAKSDRHAESDRSMTNMIGSMKNPATSFWECPEFEPPKRDRPGIPSEEVS